MRIAHFVNHSCVRSHKEAWMAVKNGHEAVLVSRMLVDLHPIFLYNACLWIWNGGEGDMEFAYVERTLKWLEGKVDVLHCHNEPDWLVPVARKVLPKMPIVYDMHDMKSLRDGKVDDYEKASLELCDAVIVPSRQYQEMIAERVPGKPVAQVLSCVPEDLMPKERCKVYHGGVVYEGGLRPVEGGTDYDFKWRTWSAVFEQILSQGTPVWAYRANLAHDFTEYAKMGVMLMGPLNYSALLQNLTGHEVGIVGSPYPDPAFIGALPNKLFEYLAAGLPVISLNAPACTEFLIATGLGVGIESPDDIPEALKIIRRDNYRDYAWEMRHNWTMERQWPKIEKVYKDAIEQKLR